MQAWLFRFLKGIFIGSGFILPGVSGGALAAVFGLYTRMIAFLAHPFKNLKQDVLFFLPVGFGALSGVFALSFVVAFVLGTYETPILWLFVGCIVGTAKPLWQQAGMSGRTKKHVIVMGLVALIALFLLKQGAQHFSGSVPQNFGTWMIAGALIALGILVPGLSPSNFLVYLGLYEPMAVGIREVDFGVMVPVALGGLLCLASLAKLINWAFSKWYAMLFHMILGVVIASTIMIAPLTATYSLSVVISSLVGLAFGIWLGAWMSNLEAKHVPVG